GPCPGSGFKAAPGGPKNGAPVLNFNPWHPLLFGPDYLVLRVSIRTLAVGPEEAGFWPVISNPSVTTWTPQFLTLEKVAPRPSSSSSQEGHDLGQANIRLLTVGERGHLLALNQRLAG